jgi:predicted small lipoprotein YifL
MSVAQRVIRIAVVMAVATALAGCGGGGPRRVIVKGRVVEGGKPLELKGDQFKAGAIGVEVTFYPLDASGKVDQTKQSQGTRVREDGSFTLDGELGKGIPVGKYKVALRFSDPMYRTPKGQGDRWEGKFALDKTPFTFDVQDASKEIVIDIGAGGGGAPAPGGQAAPEAKPKEG